MSPAIPRRRKVAARRAPARPGTRPAGTRPAAAPTLDPLLSRRDLLALGAALTGGTLLAAACGEETVPTSVGRPGRNRLVAYGDDPQQQGELFIPLDVDDPPLVTLVHGGYWSVGFDSTATRPLAVELLEAGYAVWNLSYRRVGEDGGGWPGTLEDVAAAMDLLDGLAAEEGFDLSRHACLGHSAGSQLAFWSAARPGLPDDAPGAGPVVTPTALVSLSGVLDLEAAAELPEVGRLTDLREAVHRYLGGTPEEHPDRYALASPLRRAPLGVPQLLVHGVTDDIVPPRLTERYGEVASSVGDDVRLQLVDDVSHFDTAALTTVWWSIVFDWLPEVLDR